MKKCKCRCRSRTIGLALRAWPLLVPTAAPTATSWGLPPPHWPGANRKGHSGPGTSLPRSYKVQRALSHCKLLGFRVTLYVPCFLVFFLGIFVMVGVEGKIPGSRGSLVVMHMARNPHVSGVGHATSWWDDCWGNPLLAQSRAMYTHPWRPRWHQGVGMPLGPLHT